MEIAGFTLRMAAAENAETVSAIINDGASELEDVEVARGRLIAAADPAADRQIRRMVAVDAAGTVVGYGHALREDWMEPGLYWAHTAVAPDMRRQGVGDTPAARQAMWELERVVGRDIPGSPEAAIIPYAAYVERFCDAPGYDPAMQRIAADGAEWVGLARCEALAGSDAMYNGITGVLAGWRGRGLAQALKPLVIRAATQRGAPYPRTHNDSRNAPMLAVNRKLGYQAQPGYEGMRLWLTDPR